MPNKQQLDKAAWEWAERTTLLEVTQENLETAYRIHLKACKPFSCRRNCKGNPHCHYGLGEKKWLNEIEDEAWHEVDDPNQERREPDTFAGLKNLGATCYVNSFLQVWYNNLDFRKAVYLWNPNLDLQETPTSDAEWKPKTGIGNLQLIFALLQFSSRRFVDPSPLITALGLNASLQQDAQEFSKLFISNLEERFSLQTHPLVQNAVQDLFVGQYSYITRCLKCLTESACAAKFYELDLNIKGHKDLSECLIEFLKEEKLEDNNKYSCCVCKEKQNAIRFVRLNKLPSVLNLQLLRFLFDRQTNRKKKLNSFIRFPEVLDMSSYFKTSSKTCLYQLSAVLIHKGPSAYSGHYVAHIRDRPTGTWYKFNDEYVSKMEPKTLSSEDAETGGGKAPKLTRGMHASNNAYMLVYVLKEENAEKSPKLEDWALSDYLLESIDKDNSLFEEWIVELTAMREQCVADGRNRQEEIKKVYQKISVTEDSQNEWISAEWLTKFLSDDSNVKEIDHKPFLCPHEKLNPNQVTKMKYINSEAADLLFSLYGGTLRFKDSLCKDCVTAKCQAIQTNKQLQEENKSIMSFLKQPIINKAFWVGKDSLKSWRKMATQEDPSTENTDDTILEMSNSELGDTIPDGNEESPQSFNVEISCQHGLLNPDEKSRRLVQSEVWDIFKKYFPNAPQYSSKATPCSKCEVNKKKEENHNFRQIAQNRKTLLTDLFYNRNRPTWSMIDRQLSFYIVSINFLEQWRRFINQPINVNIVDNVDNSTLICSHGNLVYQPPHAPQLILLWKKEWLQLEKMINIDVTISISLTEKGSLETNPPVCEICSSDKSLQPQHQPLTYFKQKIYVRKVVRTKNNNNNNNDSISQDENLPLVHTPKKPRLDEDLSFLRRSNRRRKQRDEKEITISSDDTLLQLKKQLLVAFGILPCEQTIIDPTGTILTDNDATLGTLGISPEIELTLEVDENVADGHSLDDIVPMDTSPETGFKGTSLVGNRT